MSGLLLNNFGMPAVPPVSTWPTPPTGSGDHAQNTYVAASVGDAAILTQDFQAYSAATYSVFGPDYDTGVPPFYNLVTIGCLTAEICATPSGASLNSAKLLSVSYPTMGIGLANGPELPTGFDPATFEVDIYMTTDFSDDYYPSPNEFVAACVGVGNLSTYPSGDIDDRVNGMLGFPVGTPVRFVATYDWEPLSYVSSDLGSPWGGSTASATASVQFGSGLGGGGGISVLNVWDGTAWVAVGTVGNPLGVVQADGSVRSYDGLGGGSSLKVYQADGSWLEVTTAS